MRSADAIVMGAGVIGLTLALELQQRGLRVIVLDKGRPGSEASSAAAGMLAVHDPANPSALRPLAELSISLYPHLLGSLREQTGVDMPFETQWTLELPHVSDGGEPVPSLADLARRFGLTPERSLDPRKLVAALRKAVQESSIDLREHTIVNGIHAKSQSVTVDTPGNALEADFLIDCTGAWTPQPVRPAKGQMLRVALPPSAMGFPERGNVVLRTPSIYIVPRLNGSAIIGATVEDVGFNTSVQEEAVSDLRERAAALLPVVRTAPEQERWAGLRPRTADDLPLIGQTDARQFVASGHFRNGILLAPATAQVVADLLLGTKPALDLAPFAPSRFATRVVPATSVA